MPRRHYRDLVVIGASAGGAQTLAELVSGLPPELPATLLVAQHSSPTAPAVLADILTRAGPLPASKAVHGEKIERGHIYVAPPDHHLLVGEGCLLVTRGPRENGHRPAVDPLFRSAARRYGQRVIAVILSGTLDDGTAGLVAVKSRGGIAVVQDPDDALHDGMPRNAIEGDHPDHVVPIADLPDLLCTLVQKPLQSTETNGGPVRRSGQEAPSSQSEQQLQRERAAGITCPECGGPLFECGHDQLPTFQCLVGHRYSAQSLDQEQAQRLEASLWTAVRSLYERAELLRRIARQQQRSHPGLSERYESRARACEEQADAVVTAIQLLGSSTEQERMEAKT